MRHAEFEEKEFEAPLYSQLLLGSRKFATPGQVFEGHFGVDAFLEILNPVFWTFFGYVAPPKGVVLNDYKWGFVWRRLGQRHPLPNFSVNALIQAKRPDALDGRRSYFSPLGIPGRYWRFFITGHQQQILEHISMVLGNRALVLYASPAFDTYDDLYHLTTAGQVVDNSSFIKVQRMSGHDSWNYDAPGTKGIAESEAEAIEDEDFYHQISRLLEAGNQNADPREELKKLHGVVVSVCKDLSNENPLARFFMNLYDQMHHQIIDKKPKDPELTVDFLTVNLFCDSTSVMWLPVGADNLQQSTPVRLT